MRDIMEDQKEREQIAAMSRVFTKMDRILSGERVECVVADVNIPAPSYTDGRTITFNRRFIKSCTSKQDIITVSGLNYHEFAHVWLTPRADSHIGRHVKVYGRMQAFNLLEDQRIETFLTARWPDTIPYLIAVASAYFMEHEQAWATNFTLTHGRRFLPREMRDEFRRRFVRPDLIPEFESIIDEYRTLIFPRDEIRGVTLIDQFNDLLNKLREFPEDPHGHHTGQRGDLVSGEAAPEQEQEQIADEVRQQDEEREQQEEQDEEQEQNGGEQSSEQSEPEEDADEDDSGSGGGDDADEDDADDEDEDDTDPDSGAGDSSDERGEPSDVSGAMSDDDFKEFMEEALDAASNDDHVRSEVNEKQTAIRNGGDVEVKLDDAYHAEALVHPDDVMMARKFGSILDQLRADTDPGWKTHTASGRLNLQRVLQGAEFSEMFDTWEEGNNQSSDIECVVIIDVSDSMVRVIEEASRAMWLFKRGMEDIAARVTVLSFASKSHLVYDGHQKVSRTKFKQMRADGVTRPRSAVEEAVRILEASSRENKILIAITDGAWHEQPSSSDHPYSADELIQMLSERGVTTALAYIADVPQSSINGHNCHVAASVRSPMETVEFAKAIVRQTMTQTVGGGR
jgi:hypothetical protein